MRLITDRNDTLLPMYLRPSHIANETRSELTPSPQSGQIINASMKGGQASQWTHYPEDVLSASSPSMERTPRAYCGHTEWIRMRLPLNVPDKKLSSSRKMVFTMTNQ
ncbi:hypothetical protein KIN20_001363 [Parelaphostrongylus tenuis]|uniref:Uncharacterized protein n=1 Tax=Parelaphostrongylus tenuis TaxID=148309 RepID=A0AAD5MF48_PARTN|nr:hypothetical protein KIN20_001363 [Parelaphostrongylus tenuis]